MKDGSRLTKRNERSRNSHELRRWTIQEAQRWSRECRCSVGRAVEARVRSGGDKEKRLETNLSEASSKQTVSVKQSEEVVGGGRKVLTRKKLLRKLHKEGKRRGQLPSRG